MTKKKIELKLGWVSPGGPPASSKSAAEQAKQRKVIRARRRRLEEAASKEAANYLRLSGDRVLEFQKALEGKLSFYWTSLDGCEAAPPSPEQVRAELRQLVANIELTYRSVNEMSEPVRRALLSECLALYPELAPPRPLLEDLKRRLRQVHAMGESALKNAPIKPGPRPNESLNELINSLANLYEEFSGKKLRASDYTQDHSFTGETGAEPELQFGGAGHLFIARCLSWLDVNANDGTVANVLKQIVEGRRRSKKWSK